MNKCVFLDRDGVLNHDRPNYVYEPGHLIFCDNIVPAVAKIKNLGYLAIVVTNQSGVDLGIYDENQVSNIHTLINRHLNQNIDDFYYCINHRQNTSSLARKPGSLLFEKAMAKYNIDPQRSWMVGDRLRDLEPAFSLGIKGVLLKNDYGDTHQGLSAIDLFDAVNKYINE